MDTDRLQKTALQGYYNTKEKALQARFKIFLLSTILVRFDALFWQL